MVVVLGAIVVVRTTTLSARTRGTEGTIEITRLTMAPNNRAGRIDEPELLQATSRYWKVRFIGPRAVIPVQAGTGDVAVEFVQFVRFIN